MKSTEYLYGKSPSELPPMDEGLIARINAASTLRDLLLGEPLETRDISPLNSVIKAINHNTAILEGNI